MSKKQVLSLILASTLTFSSLSIYSFAQEEPLEDEQVQVIEDEEFSDENLNEIVLDTETISDETVFDSNNLLESKIKQAPSTNVTNVDTVEEKQQISVKDFGAVGDGITDDTKAFQKAFEAGAGKTVFIPEGTYIISETVFIKSGTTVEGCALDSVLIASDGFTIGDDILKIYEQSNITIKNITVSGNIEVNTRERGYSAKDGVHLLDIWNASNITIEGCTFKDNVYAAIRMIKDCSNIKVQYSQFLNIDCGVSAMGTGTLDTLTVDYCYFDGHLNSEPITLWGEGLHKNVTVTHCEIKNKTKGHAIFMGHGTQENITITDNKLIDDCVGILVKNATKVNIERNEIDFSNTIGQENGKGINVTSSKDITIKNNTITKTCQQGLYINNCTKVECTDNTIKDCGYIKPCAAVDLREECADINFSNNTIIRTDDTLNRYALLIYCYGNNINIKNNVLENSIIRLDKTSSNLVVSDNSAMVENTGTNNKITGILKVEYYLNDKNFENLDPDKAIKVGTGTVNVKDSVFVSTQDCPGHKVSENQEIKYHTVVYNTQKGSVVFGNIETIAPKEITCNTVSDLKKSKDLKINDIVITKGFYKAGDGGAAKYKIEKTNKYPKDNRTIKLDNGYFATLQIEDNTIIPNQLGAYGDGIHDDVSYIQTIIDAKCNVKLVKGQNYKCIEKGIYLKNSIIFEGNNAALTIDETYKPKTGDFANYFIRTMYKNIQNKVTIKDLYINVALPDDHTIGHEFNVISPLWAKNVVLENVNIGTNESNNCINCVWINNGCDSIKIDNCNFVNQTHGRTGGALWITSRENDFNDVFNSVKSCEISNTNLYSSAGDEVLGLWGVYDFNAHIKNCKIEGNIKSAGNTRLISLFASDTATDNHKFKAIFDNCEVIYNCDKAYAKENKNTFYDSVIGIGGTNNTNTFDIVFNNTSFAGNIYGPLIHRSRFDKNNITKYDALKPNVNFTFNECNIDLNGPVTGAAANFEDTAPTYETPAYNCTFNKCSIKCKKAFAYLFNYGSMQYVPDININGCNITVQEPISFIYKSNNNLQCDLEIINSLITMNGSNLLLSGKTTILKDLKTQLNAKNQIVIKNSKLNGKNIETKTSFDTFKELSENECVLEEGTVLETKGFYKVGDGGGAKYIISNTPLKLKTPNISIELKSGKYANLQYDGQINIKQIGAKGDSTSDDFEYLNGLLQDGINIYLPSGIYYSSTYLTIPKDIEIKGQSALTSIIYFKDKPSKNEYATSTWQPQRGLITFNKNKLVVKDVSFGYIADNETSYTRAKDTTGSEGVLFSILTGSDVQFENCNFYVGGAKHPSITCMWLKSETKDIKNVKIDNCIFVNNTQSTVGGCLWMSCHDNKNTTVSDVKVTNSTFMKDNNDEIISLWGYNCNNVLIQKNTFIYAGDVTQNDVFISFGMPGNNREEKLTNVKFLDNTLSLTGPAIFAIKVQKVTPDSTIEIARNNLNANIENRNFNCLGINSGKVTLASNVFNVSGGNSNAYIVYGGGSVKDTKSSFKTNNCNFTLLVRSGASQHFDNVDLTFNGNTFGLAGTTTSSELPTIQLPASGTFAMTNCTVDTSKCQKHEICYQQFYSANETKNTNKIVLTNNKTDVNYYMHLKRYSDTTLNLTGSTFKSLNFITDTKKPCINKLILTKSMYDKIRLNYAATKVDNLKTFAKTVTK